MRTTYQYKLRPTKAQIAMMENWLELLRRQYNYRLAERFDWYERNRSPINACPLVCHLPELKDKPNFYSQCADLVNTKELFHEYLSINAQVLQNCVRRVNETFERFLKGDSNGKRSGKPRFKGIGRYRSFTYPQVKYYPIHGKFVNLPKIGKVKIILHRAIPEGFKIKTLTVIKKADGWYANFSLEDSSVPEISPELPTVDNTIGIDLGLKAFLVTSEGEEVTIPQHYRKAEQKLKKKNRSVSRKKKGSSRRSKAIKRLAKQHQKIVNQRKDFHYKTSKWLLGKGKNVGHEALNIKGIAKSRMAKSTHDAGWATFLQILEIKAERAGLLTIAVNPNGTTQECSGCYQKVPKTLSDRWHSCHHCGLELDRDHNAALNIKHRAVGHHVQAHRGDWITEPMKCEA